MNTSPHNDPVILVLAGHDPTGAAGIQADIETIHANAAKCISVITALTAQNTVQFDKIIPQDPMNFRKQVELLLADIPVNACKIGLIGSPDLIRIITDLVKKMGNIPVVVDPILQSGTGTLLSDSGIIDSFLTHLFPCATVITPNLNEAYKLAGDKDPESAAETLLNTGCQNVLITDTRPEMKTVINILYSPEKKPSVMEWERLPGMYHGSGCTLSAAITASLAQGVDIQTAVEKAQTYTWHTLKQGIKLGQGQLHPQRLIEY